REMKDMESTAFDPTQLKGTAEVAAILGSSLVRVHGSASDDVPSLVTFPGAPGTIMLILPHGQKQHALPAPTAQLVEGSVRGTIAALRAHQTRWKQKGEKAKTQKDRTAIEEKVAEYEERILALEGQVTVALPAPQPKPEIAGEHEERLPPAEEPSTG